MQTVYIKIYTMQQLIHDNFVREILGCVWNYIEFCFPVK
jgi:hypothetical protein